ncbi:hypothetical protein ABK040_000571 [Willaertia magna]
MPNKPATDKKRKLSTGNKKKPEVNNTSNNNKQQTVIPSPEKKKTKTITPSIKASIPIAPPVLNFNTTTSSSNNNNTKTTSLSKLQEEFSDKLKTAKFRYLNEKLYTTTGHEAKVLFEKDPSLFKIYHEGYKHSMQKWPYQPIKHMIDYLQSKPSNWVVADMGCGEAEIAKNVKQKVHSFDLVAGNEYITACDMRNTPLSDETCDCVIFCLSLMGTNLYDFLREANRICKVGGVLRVAELESRFVVNKDVINEVKKLKKKDYFYEEQEAEEYEKQSKQLVKSANYLNFIKAVEHFGFSSTSQSKRNGYFVVFDFAKRVSWKEVKNKKDPVISTNEVLKPCLYKKR